MNKLIIFILFLLISLFSAGQRMKDPMYRAAGNSSISILNKFKYVVVLPVIQNGLRDPYGIELYTVSKK